MTTIVTVGTVFPSVALAADLISERWRVIEDVKPKAELDVSSLEFISFLEKEEEDEYISGVEMRKRAVTLKCNLGLADAKTFLAQQEKLPKELRYDNYIVLPGTLLRRPDGFRFAPCLHWGGVRWVLSFRWLGLDWSGGRHLARLK